MKIDFQSLKTICISLPSAVERREKFKDMAERLKFSWSFYNGIQSTDYVYGCSKSHVNVLHEILDNDEPIFIAEDDIQETEFYSRIIEIPDDLKIDALYVGYSNWAAHPLRARMSTLNCASSVKKIGNFYRISNITSTHAIIYFSKEYKKACMLHITNHLNNMAGNRICDVAIARIQGIFNVFATPKHFFYQNCSKNKIWTNSSIE